MSGRDTEDPKAFPSEVGEVEELTRRSLRWLVLTSLVYRVGVTIPSIFISRSVLGDSANNLLPIVLAVVLVDVLLTGVTLRRPTWLSTKPVLFAIDMTVLLTTTTVATSLLVPGLYLLPGPDVMTGFAWGTVGLWTAARSWRAGLGIVL